MDHSFVSLTGQEFGVRCGASDDKPAAYYLAVHKSGSVLLQKIVSDVCASAGRSLTELPSDLHRQGVLPSDCPLDALLLLDQDGYVHSGFRAPWLLPYLSRYRTRPKFLLVRDPRDIAVSYFFSIQQSHAVPKKGDTRDALLKMRDELQDTTPSAFVMSGKCNPIISALAEFGRHIDRFSNVTVRRYEDVIFDKPALVGAVADTMGVELPAAQISAIAEKHDIRPDRERPSEHIRQVSPGNYKKHLSEEARTYLWRHFRPAFRRFGYARK